MLQFYCKFVSNKKKEHIMARIFNIKVHNDNTLSEVQKIIGKKCIVTRFDKQIICIIKNIVIDTNTWVHVYDIDTRLEFVALLSEIRLENNNERI